MVDISLLLYSRNRRITRVALKGITTRYSSYRVNVQVYRSQRRPKILLLLDSINIASSAIITGQYIIEHIVLCLQVFRRCRRIRPTSFMPNSCLARTLQKFLCRDYFWKLDQSKRRFTDKPFKISEKYGQVSTQNKIIEIHNELKSSLNRI